ncbi:MAG TPA: glycolate oxidase subunit GlcD, partial [Firmicutes bacterium]|nr:glycolate oxidase subunit GlcD [Bacillota bacterium]
IHTNIMCDKRDKELMKRVWDAVSEIFRFVIDIGGTISGEHGIGITKQSYLRIEKSRVEIDVYKKIKLLFDPMGIMNPGKIFT